MSDIATASRGLNAPNGELAMARLADRLAAMAPQEPLNLTSMQATSMPRPSPAVSAALSTSRAISARAAERARRSRSVTGLLVDGFVSACSFVPYALVGLALRLVMARVFFLDGQTRIEGPRLSLNVPDILNLQGFNLFMVLPAQVKVETFNAFLTQYPALPIPPVLAAYTVSYAEFVLPILLVLGLATRFAALSLLVMTALIQVYVMPQALFTAHIYWAAMLLVLLSQGAGQISIDAIIRYVARR